MCDELGRCFGEFADVARLVGHGRDILNKMMEQERKLKLQAQQADSEVALRQELARMQSLLGDCLEPKPFAPTKSTITVFYPFNGPASDKISTRYSRSQLETLVDDAIRQGVDPYAAIAIVMLENPPLEEPPRAVPQQSLTQPDGLGGIKLSEGNEAYRTSYGHMPVDPIAALDLLGCPIKAPARPADLTPEIERSLREKRKQLKSIQIDFGKSLARQNARDQTLFWESIQFQSELVHHSFSIDAAQSRVRELEHSDLPDREERIAEDKATIEELQKISARKLARNADLKKIPSVRTLVEKNSKVETLRKSIEDETKRLGKDTQTQSVAECFLDGKTGCYGVVGTQENVPFINITSDHANKKKSRYCSPDRAIIVGSSISFDSPMDEKDKVCCLDAMTEDPERLNPGELIRVKGTLGMMYIRQRLQDPMKPGSSISWALQAYNGRGCFGYTEGASYYETQCQGLIHMGDRPIYGAKAADLMVNALMRNPDINSIVEKASAENKKPPTSIFCLSNGRGTKRIHDQVFLEEQKDYLLRGAEKKFRTPILGSRNQFRIPQTEKELEDYRAREVKRAELCAPYFRNRSRSGAAN